MGDPRRASGVSTTWWGFAHDVLEMVLDELVLAGVVENPTLSLAEALYEVFSASSICSKVEEASISVPFLKVCDP